jgi:diguanylate cyclase (GGDEF)-like protein/PAS domain S-box-containing protein
VSQLSLLLFDSDWLDGELLRSHLAPQYGWDIDLNVIRSEAELHTVLSNGPSVDGVILASIPDKTLFANIASRVASSLPGAPVIVITGGEANTIPLTMIDRNRVLLLPAHQLARLPFMLEQLSQRWRARTEAFREIPEIADLSDDLYELIANLTADYIYIVDIAPDGSSKQRYRGEILCRMTGYSHEEITQMGNEALIHPADRNQFHARRASLLRGESRVDELRLQARTGETLWIRDYAYPIMEEGVPQAVRVVGAAQDITNEKLFQNRLSIQASFLEMIARGESTATVLNALSEVIEEQLSDAICSVQLVDPERNVLQSEVANRLPPGFVEEIRELPIGPDHGARGNAAYYRALMITTDIETDPRFDGHREMMRQYNLRAVWSTPIFAADGEVAGTFALYFNAPRTPRDHELVLMESAAQIAGITLDAAERETQRRLAQMQYQTLVEQTPAITLIADASDPTYLTYLSPQFSQFSDLPTSEILRNPESVRSFVHQDDRPAFDVAVQRSRDTGKSLYIEFRIKRATGSVSWMQVRMSLVRDQQTHPLHWLGVMLDVTDRNLAIKQMLDTERRYRSLFDENLNAIVIYDYEGRVVDVNPAAERISGYSAEELIGDALLWLIAPEHRDRAERYFLQGRAGISSQFSITMINKQGERIELSASQSPIVVDGEIVGVSSISEDITDRRHLESQLLHQAYHDALTGLPNRTYFDHTLSSAIGSLGKYSELAILFMDLNNFKIINDSLGHDVGDKYLKNIGNRLSEVVPRDAMVARFGGDEFTVLLPAVPDALSAASELAERIVTELATTVTIDGYELGTNVSIGIASTTLATACEPRELIRRADIALYDAKKGNRESNFSIFDEGMDEWVFERLWIEGDLRQALANGEFVIHYQPLIDAETREIMVVEALLRWNHPTRGLLVPDRFLRIGEESGHILEIDQWVMRTACQQVANWNAQHPDREPIYLGVNLSARQFWNVGLADRVMAILDETGLNPGRLCIEITENTMMRDVQQASLVVSELREHGVLFAIDDFGTGYSSLSYLREFPIDVLKIDRTFISMLGQDDQQFQLVQAIVAMSRALKLVVVAEGIEHPENLEVASHLQCDLLQGYYISCPVPFDGVTELLERHLITVY